ncbi:MAG: hypothetical protein R2798_08665 [Chitinophagales bacterium]|nr:hypothetical protein [Bacteroidota bacterium]MCB9043975.1 hypothetical protein [Chitinophagales bacterium]
MEKITTENQFIQLLYHETDIDGTRQLLQQLVNEPETLTDFLAIKEAQESLPTLDDKPSDACIDFIMNYAQEGHELVM